LIAGIYWITGKPGSGKSTLMKYLVRNSRTSELLTQWAGPHKLVVSYHYFWNAGTELQRSQQGLLRTLLFHITRQCPEAAIKHFPERFRASSTAYMHGTAWVEPWMSAELCSTIRGFGSAARGEGRLCLFIDGLDEFFGEHDDLVEMVALLANCPSNKLCISSRPWSTFRRAYDSRVDGQLQMQDLTASDIRAYIEDHLVAHERYRNIKDHDPEACEGLVEAVKAKAQGVFLWVYLVVRSLRRGLDNEDSLEMLRERIGEYPDTLDAYYRRMFDRIEKVYRKQSARVMLCALFASESMFLTGSHLSPTNKSASASDHEKVRLGKRHSTA
jgi:hypothetical protein